MLFRSFIFILAGAPWVEATRGKVGFTAPLQAITAAVVGVMAHLAIYFARHSLWPLGVDTWPDPVALAIAVVAALLMVRFKWSILRTILLCGALGLATHALGLT